MKDRANVQKNRGATIALLSEVPLFAGLQARTLARIARATTHIVAAPGVALFRRGDTGAGLYCVLSGRVKLGVPAPEHDEKVIALVGAGQIFGEAAMFRDKTHIVTAEAITQSQLVYVGKEAVLASIARDADFALRMVVLLSARLRQLMREIENSTTLTGTQRVVNFLLRELAEAGGAPGQATLALPAKKRIIASRLDLTHEHFSRILHDLAAAHLLVVDGPRVVIPDVEKLRAYYAATYSPKEPEKGASRRPGRQAGAGSNFNASSSPTSTAAG